jgi:hypothetical protein
MGITVLNRLEANANEARVFTFVLVIVMLLGLGLLGYAAHETMTRVRAVITQTVGTAGG